MNEPRLFQVSTSCPATKVLYFHQDFQPLAGDLEFRIRKTSISSPENYPVSFTLPTHPKELILGRLEETLRTLEELAGGKPPLQPDIVPEAEGQQNASGSILQERSQDRRKVLELLKLHVNLTDDQIAAQVGRSRSFVRETIKLRSRFMQDPLTDAEKSSLAENTFVDAQVQGAFMRNPQTVSRDIQDACRVQGRKVSRARICRKIRRLGLKWRLNRTIIKRKSAKVLKSEQMPQLMRILNLISAIDRYATSGIFFQDEIKFPISQISNKAWRSTNQTAAQQKPPEAPCITAAVICSPSGYTALQLFSRELTSQDYFYFLACSFHALASKGDLIDCIVIDNAPWHSLRQMRDAEWLQRRLVHNLPGWPMLNMIESTFSTIRHRYRSSMKGVGLTERARNIFDIFKYCNDPKKFGGHLRSYTRTAITIMKSTNI